MIQSRIELIERLLGEFEGHLAQRADRDPGRLYIGDKRWFRVMSPHSESRDGTVEVQFTSLDFPDFPKWEHRIQIYDDAIRRERHSGGVAGMFRGPLDEAFEACCTAMPASLDMPVRMADFAPDEERGIRYWAVIADPTRYRIEEAVRTITEDMWGLDSGSPRPGDRLVIWKSKGGTEQRGIVALAEITASPAVTPDLPTSLPFYVSQLEATPKRRIRLRYVLPPRVPLWLHDDTSGVLKELSVSRGRGAVLFHVSSGQWKRLVETLGGWPDDDLVPQKAAADAAMQAFEDQPGRARGQGFSSSLERRKAVELRAMKVAEEWLTAEGWTVTNTSATRPYDFTGTKDGATLFVEVKGTSGAGEQVFLTRNEVEHARLHRGDCALVIVYGIEIEDTPAGPVAAGGERRVFHPWDADEGELEALAFQHTPRRR